jgi:hypothetical protein
VGRTVKCKAGALHSLCRVQRGGDARGCFKGCPALPRPRRRVARGDWSIRQQGGDFATGQPADAHGREVGRHAGCAVAGVLAPQPAFHKAAKATRPPPHPCRGQRSLGASCSACCQPPVARQQVRLARAEHGARLAQIQRHNSQANTHVAEHGSTHDLCLGRVKSVASGHVLKLTNHSHDQPHDS